MNVLLVLRRLSRAVLTLGLLVLFTFVVLRASGDPAAALIGEDVPPEALEAFRARWGLDEPLAQQFLAYFLNLLKGDFGFSFMAQGPAADIILERLPKTLALMGLTTVATLCIGIPAGIYAALHRNSWLDRTTMGITVASFSMPNFVVGIFLILLFGVVWRLLPTSGSETVWHYVLPIVTMASGDAAVFARFSRSAMLEVLHQPYMRTALAKGASWRRALRRHAIPNAAIPLVTVTGLYVGRVIAAAVVTENVFAWPGLGKLLVTAVEKRDFAVVQGIVLLVGTTMITANVLVDLTYGWLDPRTRAKGRS